MIDIVLGNICSIGAMLSDSYSGTRKTKKEMLLAQSVSQIFYLASSIILKGYSAAAQNVVSIFRNIAVAYDKETKILEYIFIVLPVILGVVFNNRGLIGLLPVFANLEYVLAMVYAKNDSQKLKIAFIVNCALFSVFNFYILNVVGGIFSIVIVVTTAISVYQTDKNTPKDINFENRRRCILALVLSLTVFFACFVTLIFVLTYSGEATYHGLENLRYFTHESSIFVGVTSVLTIPFEIEGLKNRNYHLPRWIVNVVYVSVCTISLTFLLALFIVFPIMGFHFTYGDIFGLLPHFITPILAILMFIFVNDDHEIKKEMVIIATIPVITYAYIYVQQVFASQAWIDHYLLSDAMPLYLSISLTIIVHVIISISLRHLHNKRHQIRKQEIKEYYTNGPEVSYPTIKEAIKQLAIKNKQLDKGGDMIVPRRIILMMEEKYQSGIKAEELYKMYIKSYVE